MLRNNGDVRRCLYFELGLLVLVKPGFFLIFASCELAGGGEGLRSKIHATNITHNNTIIISNM